ncbi:MAG: 4-hydroxy-3-methylbut-2-enyl diphosphate reductase [Nanoarchaeota archaeon]
MEVKLAKQAGFCFGVRKAVDEALNIQGKANTIGPLIHNRYVVKELEKKGIREIDSLSDSDAPTIIIRTHGASDRLIHEIVSKGHNILDLTCPFVKKVQQYAKDLEKEGYKVIIIGEKNHPEVLAIADNLEDAIIVEKPEDVDGLGRFDKIGVVVQTTQSVSNFTNIISKLESKSDKFRIHNTICNATKERQEGAVKLAKEVDLMIIVGGKDSANTKRLTELCSKIVDTKQIESEYELDKKWLKGKEKIGIAAGASTPDSIIKRIKEKLTQ